MLEEPQSNYSKKEGLRTDFLLAAYINIKTGKKKWSRRKNSSYFKT